MRKIYLASLFLIIAGIFGIWRLTAWAGTTWQGVPNGCNSPNIATCNTDGVVWLRPNPAATSPQPGGFNIGGDAAISDGKAIRVDKSGTSNLNFGNWFDGDAVLNMNVAGNVNLTNHGVFTTPTLTAYQVKGTNSLCIAGVCRTTWPSAGVGTVTSITGGTGLDGGNITGAGTLSINAAYQLPQACAANQVPKYNAGTWICANDVDTNSGGDITDVTSVIGSGIAVTNSAGPIPQISISNTDSMGCAANQGRLWNGAAWACTSLPTVAASDAKYVFRAGDTMTGLLTVTVPHTVAGDKSMFINGAADYGIYTQNAGIGNVFSGVSYGVWGAGTGATGDGGFFIGNRYGVYAEERAAGGVAVYGKATGIIVGTAGRFESTNIALDIRGRANFNDVIIDGKDFLGSTLTVTNNYAGGGTHWAGSFTANNTLGIGVSASGYQYGLQATNSGPGGYAVFGQDTSGSGFGGKFSDSSGSNFTLLGAPGFALSTSGINKLGGESQFFGDLKMQAGWSMCFNNGAVPATDCISSWPVIPSTANLVKKTGDTMTGMLIVQPPVGSWAAIRALGVSGGRGISAIGGNAGQFQNIATNGPMANIGTTDSAGQFVYYNLSTGAMQEEVNLAESQGLIHSTVYEYNGGLYGAYFDRQDSPGHVKYHAYLVQNTNALDVLGPSIFNGDMTVIGVAYKTGGGSWAATSDMRLKKNIIPMTGALGKISSLKPVNFEWINPENHANQKGVQGGFVAQDIEKYFPDWISLTDPDGKDVGLVQDKVKNVALPVEFDALVVESIKELKAQNEMLQAENTMLLRRLEALEAKVK